MAPPSSPISPAGSLADAFSDANTCGSNGSVSPILICGSSPATLTPGATPISPAPPPQLANIVVHAQDCSGSSLASVVVSVSGKGWDGITDKSGNFDFGEVPAGAYTVTGDFTECSVKASQTQSAPAAATTVYTLKFCAVKAEIEINNTAAVNDDLVQLKCDHPAHRHKVSCRIRLTTAAAHDHQFVLSNPDSRLRFPETANTTKNLTLPVSKAWVPFELSGQTESAAIGDAKIEAKLAAACPDGGTSNVADLKASKNATVFWFDSAKIQLTQGTTGVPNSGNYVLAGGYYSAVGGPAVSFSAQASIKPAGVDCSTAQVKDLRIGIMQESRDYQITTTWDTPVLGPAAPHGTAILVPPQMRETIKYGPAVTQPVNDGLTVTQEPPAGAYPLYSMNAITPPMGCGGGAAATSSDNPGQSVAAQGSQSVGGVPVVWSRLVNTTRTENFRTFCVVFNTVTKQYCALRQATWSVNVDSAGPAASQHVTVTGDGTATADPATGVQANNAASSTTNAGVGLAATPLMKP